MALGRLVEKRTISYQAVFGKGDDWFTALTQAGVPTSSPMEAIQLVTAWGCVRLVGTTLGQLPIDQFRQSGTTKTEMAPGPLVANPSARVSPSAWKFQFGVAAALWGNAVGGITARDGAGYPTQVEWLPMDKVRGVQEFIGGPIRWTLGGSELPSGDVFHVPYQPLPGSALGFAPLISQGLVTLGKKAQEFGTKWFQNGAVPSGILYNEDPNMDETQAKDAKRAFMRGARNRQPVVFGSAWKYEAMSVAANESQFLETIRQNQTDICQAFGVPPEMLGVATSGSSVTYANREQRTQDFLTFCGNGYIVALQEALTAALPRPDFVRVNTAALLRSDLTTRLSAERTGIEAGVYLPNEAREKEDLPPIAGGDVSPGAVASVGALVRAGFEPAAALEALGLPPIAHTGLVPITVQGDAVATGKVG